MHSKVSFGLGEHHPSGTKHHPWHKMAVKLHVLRVLTAHSTLWLTAWEQDGTKIVSTACSHNVQKWPQKEITPPPLISKDYMSLIGTYYGNSQMWLTGYSLSLGENEWLMRSFMTLPNPIERINGARRFLYSPDVFQDAARGNGVFTFCQWRRLPFGYHINQLRVLNNMHSISCNVLFSSLACYFQCICHITTLLALPFRQIQHPGLLI